MSCTNAKNREYLKKQSNIFYYLTKLSTTIVLFLIVGILTTLSVLSWPSVKKFGFGFFTSTKWDAIHNQFGGLIPIYGTIITSSIALIIAVPISFGLAIFLTEIAPQWLKRPLSIAIELLAGIPSIVYGIWGLFVFAPVFAKFNKFCTHKIPALSKFYSNTYFGVGLFTAGIVLAIMIIPYISAIMRDIFLQTPITMKESAYGIGCTTWEVIWYVVIPCTKKSVIGSVMLGLGRALGETMAVTFVIGNTYQEKNFSLFMPGNSITSSLANEFGEAQSRLHISALMELSLILFFITFIVLIISKLLVKRLSNELK